jgi:hypothetical protein
MEENKIEVLYKNVLDEVKYCYSFNENEVQDLDFFIREIIPVVNAKCSTYSILELIHYVKNLYYNTVDTPKLDRVKRNLKIVFVYSLLNENQG